MGLIAHPPTTPGDSLDLTGLFDTQTESPLRRRTLAPEWFPQSGIQLTWPHQHTDWAYMLDEITECYVRMAYEIATRQTLLIVCPDIAATQALLESRLPRRATAQIRYHACPTNDTWARDHGFLTVVGTETELLDFRFDGWGNKFEATLDNAINRHIYDAGILQGRYTDCLDFTLEGGSIETDGRGTLLTTSRCLLNPNRNPNLSPRQIEQRLRQSLGIDRILWLDHGHLAGDDTDSHIDTLARMCPHDTIVYVQCSDPDDEHFAPLRHMEAQLLTFRTPDNAPYRLIPLPMPAPICDTDGERLPATYANYLIMNTAILYPTYAQPEHDDRARRALQLAYPHHDIVGIDCRPLIRQHGSLHCATMQFPRGVLAAPQAATS